MGRGNLRKLGKEGISFNAGSSDSSQSLFYVIIKTAKQIKDIYTLPMLS